MGARGPSNCGNSDTGIGTGCSKAAREVEGGESGSRNPARRARVADTLGDEGAGADKVCSAVRAKTVLQAKRDHITGQKSTHSKLYRCSNSPLGWTTEIRVQYLAGRMLFSQQLLARIGVNANWHDICASNTRVGIPQRAVKKHKTFLMSPDTALRRCFSV